MNYHSTRKAHPQSTLRNAALKGLAPDGGLYVPESVPRLSLETIVGFRRKSVPEIALSVISPFVGGEVAGSGLRSIVSDAFDFEVPLMEIEPGWHSLELFHGPSLAFKDFGARFMSRLFSCWIDDREEERTILVATSGDTGSAVAHGFHGVPGIRVVILYPSGRVSRIQEAQLTALGDNVRALEVDGTFDDCQKLAKEAFRDPELTGRLRLGSANSINITRLIPQLIYYFWAASRLAPGELPPVFSVPSGNLGNLTAGLMAARMGLPVSGFVAGLNRNDALRDYLETGRTGERRAVPTISNAMDVGVPSNLERIRWLYSGSQGLGRDLRAYSYDDDQTREALREVRERTGYVMDPHGGVGYLAGREFVRKTGFQGPLVFLETAHPGKFADVVEEAIGEPVEIPAGLREMLNREGSPTRIPASFEALHEVLTGRL